MRKIILGLGALALGVGLASGAALAQTGTYPFTISSPAFGPGVPASNVPARRPVTRAHETYAHAVYPHAYMAQPEVWQTYPLTVASPAFGPGPQRAFER